MPKLNDLHDCAPTHLDAYCNNRGGRYAWVTYDGPGNPEKLSAADVLATGFVNAPIGKRHIWEMFGSDNQYSTMRRLLQLVLDRSSYSSPVLENWELEGELGEAVIDVMSATDSTAWFTPTLVSKILHRKRPNLIPMMDKHVYGSYAEGSKDWRKALAAIRTDLRAHEDWLDELRAPYRSPDGLPMTRLRALDIIVWHHDFAGDKSR